MVDLANAEAAELEMVYRITGIFANNGTSYFVEEVDVSNYR